MTVEYGGGMISEDRLVEVDSLTCKTSKHPILLPSQKQNIQITTWSLTKELYKSDTMATNLSSSKPCKNYINNKFIAHQL